MAAIATTGIVAGSTSAAGATEPRLRVVALTTEGSLVKFWSDSPWATSAPRPVTGLAADSELVGVDYRIQDGRLYGVGDAGGVYLLKPRTGAATQVSQLSVALDGASFGVDFNPAADRLRVVSDAGQNLRHDLNTDSTVADTTLSYPPAAPPATGVTSAAYTNNDLATGTATSLFDIDTTLDQVAVQSPANSGQLAATGKLGVDAVGSSGFDIFSSVAPDGETRTNTGLAVLSVGGSQELYGISLLTGRASGQGRFAAGVDVTDLSVPIVQP